MDSFTIELVSNASFNCFPDNTLSSFSNFLPEQINLDGQWEVAISELSYPSMYQNITLGKFFYTEFSKEATEPPEPYTIKPGLYTSISEIINAMNNLISDRMKRKEKYITAHVDKITQQVNISLRKDISSLVFCSNDLTHIFGVESLEPDSGLLMYGIGPHKNQLAYDIVRIHSLMIYSDLVEYNIIGDTKAPLLRCIPFISKIENGDVITTGQYMNYQTFSNLQFKRLLKNTFHSIKIELRDSTGEKIPFVSVGITRVTLMFRKISNNHF